MAGLTSTQIGIIIGLVLAAVFIVSLTLALTLPTKNECDIHTQMGVIVFLIMNVNQDIVRNQYVSNKRFLLYKKF